MRRLSYPEVTLTESLAETAGKALLRGMEDVLSRQPYCRLGLSGGSTPGSLFTWLKSNIPAELYPSLWISWVDERFLPLESSSYLMHSKSFHADTNAHLTFERWLDDVPFIPAQILLLGLDDCLPLDMMAEKVSHRFSTEFKGQFDMLVLGAGEDGHYASIFPGIDAPKDGPLCYGVHNSPKAPLQRLTFAQSVLEDVSYSFLLAKGAAKAQMLGKAFHGEDAFPLSSYQPKSHYQWILDFDAGALLKEVAHGN